MRSQVLHPAIVAAALIAGSGILAGGFALRPAFADGNNLKVHPDTNCSSNAPCQTYHNSGAGAGLAGTTAKGIGLVGTATTTGNAISASSVKGTAVNVKAVDGYGIDSNSTNGIGIFGASTSQIGVYASSFYSTALWADSANDIGVFALGEGNQPGVFAQSYQSYGLEARADFGAAVFAVMDSGQSAPALIAEGANGDAMDVYGDGALGAYINNANGDGTDIRGTYIGIIGRAPASGGFPIALTDQDGNNLFWVDGAGDVFYRGSLNSFARTRFGDLANAYEAKSASPMVEDTGSAQLVNGAVVVNLDPAFAQTIDVHHAYRVMLTPDGDTRGLFVASKSPTSFVVREVQGGHGSLNFDYHIYAPAAGQANDRMAVMTRAQLAAVMPKAQPAVHRAPKPTTVPMHRLHN